jgi:hypothetical protein
MKFIAKMLAIVFSLVLLAALIGSAYYLFKSVTNLFAKMDHQTSLVVGIVSITVLLSALAISGSIREARKRAREQHLVRDKAALYERIIHEWVDAHGRGTGSIELGESLQGLERSLALRAGPGVLKAYTVLKTLQEDSVATGPETRAQFGAVLFEMRKDLGLSNQWLKSGELLQTLLGVSGMGRERTEESTRLSCETTAMR